MKKINISLKKILELEFSLIYIYFNKLLGVLRIKERFC